MPRAALLSIHARVAGTGPATSDDPSLVQLCGPRFHVSTIWTVPPPQTGPRAARLEPARRYLHIYGPATPEAFGRWSGTGTRHGVAAFEALGSPGASCWARNATASRRRRSPCRSPAPTSLSPSGGRTRAQPGKLWDADDTARERSRAARCGTPKGQLPRNLSGIRDRAGQAALEPALARTLARRQRGTLPDSCRLTTT
jgi:hypothetical protein